MNGLLGNKQNVPHADIEKLFNAGIVYLQAGEYAFAYFCFDIRLRKISNDKQN